MLYQAVWFYCAMCSRKCPFQHSCLVNYVVRKERIDFIEAAREARVVINIMGAEGGDPSVWKKVYEQGKQIAAEFDIEPKKAKNNKKAATQGECLSHKPRVLLAKSCVSPSYWSFKSRNEWQALITGGSLPRPVTSPNKTARIKQRRPR